MMEYPDAGRLMAGELGSWLGDQRLTRKRAIERSNDRIFRVALFGLPTLAVAWIFGLSPFDIPIELWGIAGAALWAWTQKPKWDAKKKVKSGINESIAEALGITYAHDCGGSAAFSQCKEFKLLPTHDRAKFEDLWQGHFGGSDFLLHEADLWRKSGDNTERVWRGVIIDIAFERPFHGTHLLVEDAKFSKFFGGSKDEVDLGGYGLRRSQISSPEFEDRFDLYTSDPTEAHWLVHPEYAERLLAVEAAFAGDRIATIFSAGQVIIAVKGGNQFESGSLDADEDHSRVAETIDQFARLADLMLTLNRIRPDRAA